MRVALESIRILCDGFIDLMVFNWMKTLNVNWKPLQPDLLLLWEKGHWTPFPSPLCLSFIMSFTITSILYIVHHFSINGNEILLTGFSLSMLLCCNFFRLLKSFCFFFFAPLPFYLYIFIFLSLSSLCQSIAITYFYLEFSSILGLDMKSPIQVVCHTFVVIFF